jgi:hypothetical protein
MASSPSICTLQPVMVARPNATSAALETRRFIAVSFGPEPLIESGAGDWQAIARQFTAR